MAFPKRLRQRDDCYAIQVFLLVSTQGCAGSDRLRSVLGVPNIFSSIWPSGCVRDVVFRVHGHYQSRRADARLHHTYVADRRWPAGEQRDGSGADAGWLRVVGHAQRRGAVRRSKVVQ